MVVNSFAELHAALEPFLADKRWLFRGHTDASWALVPKAGRGSFARVPDQMVFETWKRRAIEFVPIKPADDWDWLAIAQHHGLATRLLDWSLNPLNAAFFAVRTDRPTDSVIVAVKPKNNANCDEQKPMEIGHVSLFRPRAVVPRIVRQGGVFTIHPDPTTPLHAGHADLLGYTEMVIPAASKGRLLAQLAFYGINSATLFPDLDGLSDFVNWGVSSGEYFR